MKQPPTKIITGDKEKRGYWRVNKPNHWEVPNISKGLQNCSQDHSIKYEFWNYFCWAGISSPSISCTNIITNTSSSWYGEAAAKYPDKNNDPMINCKPLIFTTGKRCRKHPVCCLFAQNTPNCLQQNEIFKILWRKHSGFELPACTLQWTEPLGHMALIVPGTSQLREDSCKSHPKRPCQHLPSSNGLVGSPHTWQHFQEHTGSCLATFRIKILLAQHARKSEKLPKWAASSEWNHLHNVEEAGRERNILGFCSSCKILNSLNCPTY